MSIYLYNVRSYYKFLFSKWFWEGLYTHILDKKKQKIDMFEHLWLANNFLQYTLKLFQFSLKRRVQTDKLTIWVSVMVLNATFNSILVILWWYVLLVDETADPEKNHRTVVSHWKNFWSFKSIWWGYSWIEYFVNESCHLFSKLLNKVEGLQKLFQKRNLYLRQFLSSYLCITT